jgi:hypothetical protein
MSPYFKGARLLAIRGPVVDRTLPGPVLGMESIARVSGPTSQELSDEAAQSAATANQLMLRRRSGSGINAVSADMRRQPRFYWNESTRLSPRIQRFRKYRHSRQRVNSGPWAIPSTFVSWRPIDVRRYGQTVLSITISDLTAG